MSIRRHIKPEEQLNRKEDHLSRKHDKTHEKKVIGSRYEYGHILEEGVPKYRIPEKSTKPDLVYNIIKEEMYLDSVPELDCATFLTTSMDKEAEKLIMENLYKNFVDQDGFPSSQIIHERCISMIAHLWNAPKDGNTIGTACGGSSEAVMLGCLAMKWIWREKAKVKNVDTTKPNIVFGSNAHCCIEKFARYFDVEARIIPVKAENDYVMDAEDAIANIDENTIGVVSILGSTYTGHFENISALSDKLDKLYKEKGFDVPIHVDAASAGFIAPFSYRDLQWGFEVKRVVSINSSGHKFGLVYPGIGWVLWKSKEHLHKDLIFELHYLGTTEYSFTLNFSRPTSHIVAQYYNFVRLGLEGYTSIMNNCLANARILSVNLENSKYFKVLSKIHLRENNKSFTGDKFEIKQLENGDGYNYGLPLVAFTFSDSFKKDYPQLDISLVAHLMKSFKWLLPSYNLPPACESIKILRVVVKETTSRDMINNLYSKLITCVEALLSAPNSNIGITLSALTDNDDSFNPVFADSEKDKFSKQDTFSAKC